MAFWDALSGDFETLCSQISCSGTKTCSKIEVRIINFGTWVPGKLPGDPQEVPKAKNTDSCPIFRHRFWVHVWCQNLKIVDSICFVEKSELRERILMDFGDVLGGPTLIIYCIYKLNQWFFIFELVGIRETFWHKTAVKMISKWNPKPVQNEIRNDVWNRSGFEWRFRIDFPGFG